MADVFDQYSMADAWDEAFAKPPRCRGYADVTPVKGGYHGAPSTGLGVTV